MATHSGILPRDPMDRGAWRGMFHRVTKELDRTSDQARLPVLHPDLRL